MTGHEDVYLAHDAGVDGLYADVLAVEVQSVHQGLGGPDQFVALPVAGAEAQLPLQIHVDVVVLGVSLTCQAGSVSRRCLLIKPHVVTIKSSLDCVYHALQFQLTM